MIKLWILCKGLTITLILFAGIQSLASAQPVARELTGTVYGQDSLTQLSRVTVLNKRSRELTVTNPVGFFSIQVTDSDTLMITSIGFTPSNIPVSSLPNKTGVKVKIIMQSSVYELKPISFTIHRVPKVDHQYYQRIFSRPKPTVSSPISALYERYSKRGRELRQLETDYNEYEYQKFEMNRFRNAIFPTILDDLEMIRLIEHCKLPSSFVKNAIDYDFNFTVKECMKTFSPNKTPGN
jgi:hypothetical protein